MSITTKKGDNLTTDIKNKRVFKYDDTIEALGQIDDTIAYLLLADSYLDIVYIKEIVDCLSNIAGKIAGYCDLKNLNELTNKMEDYITKNEKAFSFSYQYKQTNKLYVNLARTKVRDLERILTKLHLENKEIYQFVNRLSDFLYIISLS